MRPTLNPHLKPPRQRVANHLDGHAFRWLVQVQPLANVIHQHPGTAKAYDLRPQLHIHRHRAAKSTVLAPLPHCLVLNQPHRLHRLVALDEHAPAIDVAHLVDVIHLNFGAGH